MNEPFQLEKEIFKKWFLIYFDRLREAETELIFYQSMIEGLRVHFADLITKMEKTVREKADKKTLDRTYEERRREVIDAIENGFHHQAILLFLKEWKGTGSIN